MFTEPVSFLDIVLEETELLLQAVCFTKLLG